MLNVFPHLPRAMDLLPDDIAAKGYEITCEFTPAVVVGKDTYILMLWADDASYRTPVRIAAFDADEDKVCAANADDLAAGIIAGYTLLEARIEANIALANGSELTPQQHGLVFGLGEEARTLIDDQAEPVNERTNAANWFRRCYEDEEIPETVIDEWYATVCDLYHQPEFADQPTENVYEAARVIHCE